VQPPQTSLAQRLPWGSLPESYRRFLRDFGWVSIDGDEIFGLGADVPSHLDLVRITQSERTQFRPYLPPHLAPLLNDGAGNHYCLDTRRSSGKGRPVVFWNHEHELAEQQDPADETDDFVTWLSERAESQ